MEGWKKEKERIKKKEKEEEKKRGREGEEGEGWVGLSEVKSR